MLLEPSFEGWLAPPTVDPARLQATLLFSACCSSLWTAGGLATRGFAFSANLSEPDALRSAARTALAAASVSLICAFASSMALGACVEPFCADAALWEQPGARVLQLTPDLLDTTAQLDACEMQVLLTQFF